MASTAVEEGGVGCREAGMMGRAVARVEMGKGAESALRRPRSSGSIGIQSCLSRMPRRWCQSPGGSMRPERRSARGTRRRPRHTATSTHCLH